MIMSKKQLRLQVAELKVELNGIYARLEQARAQPLLNLSLQLESLKRAHEESHEKIRELQAKLGLKSYEIYKMGQAIDELILKLHGK